MCYQELQHTRALVSNQSHSPILVMMVWWFLVCILSILTITRLALRLTSRNPRHLSAGDDAFVVASALCALGSILTTSTAVDSGLANGPKSLQADAIEQFQRKLYASTILFVLSIGLSKFPVLLFLYRSTSSSMQRLLVALTSVLALVWTTVVMTGVVFECEMPRPWGIWTGQCIPLVPFWITSITIDILIDAALILLPIHMIWTRRLEYQQKTLATTIFLFRILLVILLMIRMVYLHRFLSFTDPKHTIIPYLITTHFHSTLSVIIACALALKPLAILLQSSNSSHGTGSTSAREPGATTIKHWSSSIIGGPPYTPEPTLELTKEPLDAIQASMSTPTSPYSSKDCLAQDVLPMIRYMKTPPRPPPPTEEQRPDLSMFTRTGIVTDPPMVTRLGSGRCKGRI